MRPRAGPFGRRDRRRRIMRLAVDLSREPNMTAQSGYWGSMTQSQSIACSLSSDGAIFEDLMAQGMPLWPRLPRHGVDLTVQLADDPFHLTPRPRYPTGGLAAAEVEKRHAPRVQVGTSHRRRLARRTFESVPEHAISEARLRTPSDRRGHAFTSTASVAALYSQHRTQ